MIDWNKIDCHHWNKKLVAGLTPAATMPMFALGGLGAAAPQWYHTFTLQQLSYSSRDIVDRIPSTLT